MLPIRLTIEGLYSYQERQIIDFSNLLDAGLFGIFGAVGSGKSSILEAITFALYGETERLNARDKRYYNMMNLKSNRSYIEFDFINFENRIFRASREFKRNSKNFDDVKTSSVIFYEYKNEVWLPLEITNATDIIGLSYDNFKRTIIIPQGQFKEFIELGPSERTRMMKEIFGLHRFDLQDKVAKLSNENKSQLDQLNGQLLGYAEISPEMIEELQKLLDDQRDLQKSLEEEFQIANDKFQLLKNLKTDFEELAGKKQQFAEVLSQKDNIDRLQQQLQQYETVHQIFYQLLIERKKLHRELDNRKNELNEQQSIYSSLEQKHESLDNRFKILKSEFDQLENKKKQVGDLELIAKTKSLIEKTAVVKTNIAQQEKQTEQIFVQIKELEKTIDSGVAQIEQWKQHKLHTQILVEVAEWFAKNQKLQGDRIKSSARRNEIQQEIEGLDMELGKLNLSPSLLEEEINRIQDRKQLLSQKKSQLDIQQKLSEYAHALHDGEACPLCGAIEHPGIAHHEDLSEEITLLHEQIAACEDAVKEIQHKWSEAQKLIERKSLYQEQVQRMAAEIIVWDTEIQQHLTAFTWTAFDSKDQSAFEEQRKNSLKVEKNIQDKEKELSLLRNQIATLRNNLEKSKQDLSNLQLSYAQAEAQIQNNKSHLHILIFEEFEQETILSIQQKHKDLAQYIVDTELAYHSAGEELQQLKTNLAAQETRIQSIKSHLENLCTQLQQVQDEIDAALKQQHFNDIEEVRAILAWQLDMPTTRQILEKYKIQFETLRSAITTLEQKLNNRQFNEEEFSLLENQVAEMSEKVKTGTADIARAEANLQRTAKQYEEKKTLLSTRDKLQLRADNLKTMTKLFKGSGFVEYVSSIYLRQLCDHANVRFHRMSRNQLSLTLNENNDFEIIDYLNEGKSRSVKTLSGGQAFQVSLSLALALAESVQTNAMADKNFFFIDEGFGTQDHESVNIVFETLLSLQRENRIVGIISHVEELKERIPLSISVRKDEERGSLICEV